VAFTKGFKYANSGLAIDYTYDANGNLISDKNKGITSIVYNFLNLPQTITFANNNVIQFVYDATGAKMRKITIDNSTATPVTVTTEYINGVEYRNNVTQRIANAEGQITRTATATFQKEYDLRDHLGNTRVTFCDLNNDGLVNDAEILQSNNYYAFGLNMEMNTNGANGNNKYQYNGKEWNDDFGLGLNDYGARMYDPAIGRWNSVDPLAEISRKWSPYNYALDNPIRYIDPDGMKFEDPKVKEKLDQKIDERTNAVKKAVDVLKDKIANSKNDGEKKSLQKYVDSGEKQLKELAQSKADISALDKDDQHTYRLVKGDPESQDHHVEYNRKDKVVEIQGSNTALHIHEIRHISLSLSTNNGRLEYSAKEGAILLKITSGGIADEVSAYRAQFSFNGMAPGISGLSSVNYIEQINERYVGRCFIDPKTGEQGYGTLYEEWLKNNQEKK